MSDKSSTARQWQRSSEYDSPGGGPVEPTAVACNPCRKRKLRCSRELPACQHCRKTVSDCVYETKRIKPGPKPGAVENVHKRLDALERIVHRLDDDAQLGGKGPSGRDGDVEEDGARSQERSAYGILALLARELPKFLKDEKTGTAVPAGSDARFVPASSKRRRIDDGSISGASNVNRDEQDAATLPSLPPPRELDAILDAYFACIHPWIPMLHQIRFRRRLADPQERSKLDVVLHAMVLVASRFVSDYQYVMAPNPARLRTWVVSMAMDCMSVESLQAIVMVAFNDIGSGQASKAWSLVGSMTRTVEYLQLTVERDESKRRPLSQPFASLAPTDDWTENEERRRVFWNVFALDRFCSVAMGWNTSLTSDDVHRRLPCDGILWRKQDPVITTPFFGIWDKVAARIGNPIAFLPSQPSAVMTAVDADSVSGPSQPDSQIHNPTLKASSQGAFGADMTTVGAYAYCIEATESLSRITSHFLQQRIDWCDARDVGLWLTRFKELDLRLVHWKMLLPHKWKPDSYLRGVGSAPLVMDPNLTLAHVTHNASLILLHQPIAFPPTGWAFRTRLPSACSVETCLAAATEVTTITTKYLESTAVGMPVAHQYAFCVYMAARVLLVHWRYGYIETELPGEFWTLVRALDEFSLRWRGGSGSSIMAREPAPSAWDLSAKYARRLRELHTSCLQGVNVNLAAYTAEIDHSSTAAAGDEAEASSSSRGHNPSQTASLQRPGVVNHWGMYGSSDGAPSPLSTREWHHSRGGIEMFAHSEDSLGSISQALLHQQFGEMDRIISFEDGTMFAAAMNGTGEASEAWLSAEIGMQGNM